ncbi:hypothetical protein [Streptomyces sp.]|uniref:hypothetical protein n=1 Tax=Streptomyces sp. TaxID=1931 RepID=UPI002810CC7D|nr:hypothetical protein [Streptomyces sp.]
MIRLSEVLSFLQGVLTLWAVRARADAGPRGGPREPVAPYRGVRAAGRRAVRLP